MSEPLVSIVIPAYNDAQTLGRAVDSCLAQTITDIEVVIVDDASTDATPAVADLYAQRDPRIHVVTHKENCQALEARRTGVKRACAPYILLLDGDDWLDPEVCEQSLSLAYQTEADVVCFPMVPEYGAILPDRATLEGRACMYDAPDLDAEGDDVVHATYRDDRVVWTIIGKLFSRKLLLATYDRVPVQRMFQCEDSYLYFIASTLADRLVSRSNLPVYHYAMGIGATRADAQNLTASQFDSICKNYQAALRVEEYLNTLPNPCRFKKDYAQLRFRLLADPTTRFPHAVDSGARPEAFDAMLKNWPSWEALGWLAARHWTEPAAVLDAVQGAMSLKPRRHVCTEVIGVLCGPLELTAGQVGLTSDKRDRLEAALAEGAGMTDAQRIVFFGDVDIAGDIATQEDVLDRLVDQEPRDSTGLPFTDNFDIAGVHAGDCKVIEKLPTATGGCYPLRAKELDRLLREHDVDVLVCDLSLDEPSLVWDTLVARACGVSCVVFSPAWFMATTENLRAGMADACAKMRALQGENEGLKESAARFEADAARERDRADGFEKGIADVRRSVSFRLGRLLTAPLRTLRNFVHRGA